MSIKKLEVVFFIYIYKVPNCKFQTQMIILTNTCKYNRGCYNKGHGSNKYLYI